MLVLKCELNKIRDKYERFGTVITFLRTTKLKTPVTILRPTKRCTVILMSVFEKILITQLQNIYPVYTYKFTFFYNTTSNFSIKHLLKLEYVALVSCLKNSKIATCCGLMMGLSP